MCTHTSILFFYLPQEIGVKGLFWGTQSERWNRAALITGAFCDSWSFAFLRRKIKDYGICLWGSYQRTTLMEAWSEDFNPIEKSAIQSFPQTWEPSNPLLQVSRRGAAPLGYKQCMGRGGGCLHAPAADAGPQCSIPSQTLPQREAKQLSKQPRSFIACKDSSCHAQISYGCITQPALACSLHRHQIFHLALGIMLSRESCRVEMRGHHHRRDVDSQSQAQVPPDLCIYHARWCWFSLMPSKMRSGDQGWCVG